MEWSSDSWTEFLLDGIRVIELERNLAEFNYRTVYLLNKVQILELSS